MEEEEKVAEEEDEKEEDSPHTTVHEPISSVRLLLN